MLPRWALVFAIGALAAVIAFAALALASSSGQRPTVSSSLLADGRDPVFRGARIPAGKVAPDFVLKTERGVPIRLSEQRGKLVLLAFLYTHCGDICPLIALRLDDAVRSLRAQARDVRVFAISVDPEGDTPHAARAYIRSHNLGPEFHWLIGKRQELWPVWHDYNVGVSPDQDANSIAHTAPVILLDQEGRPRVYYQQPERPSGIAHDLRALLEAPER